MMCVCVCVCVCVCACTHACTCLQAQWLSCIWLFVTLWIVAHQAPLSMRFSRQEYRSGLPFPPPGEISSSSWPSDWTWVYHVSCIGRWILCCCSVAQSCLTLRDPMDCSTPGFPVPQHLPEFAQVHVHWIGDAIQPSHPLSPSSPSAFNFLQQGGFFPTRLNLVL